RPSVRSVRSRAPALPAVRRFVSPVSYRTPSRWPKGYGQGRSGLAPPRLRLNVSDFTPPPPHHSSVACDCNYATQPTRGSPHLHRVLRCRSLPPPVLPRR